MKNKSHNHNPILNYILNQERFKGVFWITVLLCFYGAFGIAQGRDVGIIDGGLVVFTFPVFNLVILAIMLFNTVHVCSILDSYLGIYLMRFQTKKKALTITIFYNVVVNFLYLILVLLLLFSFLLFSKGGFLNLGLYMDYGVHNLVYLFFYLFRYIIILLLISVVNTICYQKFREKILFINCLFWSGFILIRNSNILASWYTIIPYQYFSITRYSTFITEIASSLFFLLILQLLIFCLFKLYCYVKEEVK